MTRKTQVGDDVSTLSVRSSPLEVEAKVLEHTGSRQKGAAHAGKELPVAKVCSSIRGRCVAGLFHELTVDLVAEGPQVQAGLEDTLDDGNGLPRRLQLLQAVKQLHGLLADGAIALPAVVCAEVEVEVKCCISAYCNFVVIDDVNVEHLHVCSRLP